MRLHFAREIAAWEESLLSYHADYIKNVILHLLPFTLAVLRSSLVYNVDPTDIYD